MSTKIYPQETFEQQTNGTVFYKEGRLNDFPSAKDGIFESWRYNFDEGRQVFRATEDAGGKIYEKRLVKDIYGNPTWTGWMEIPNAEANGIQAIAVNDRPLQLPNSDGAIKLQITPHSINAYSKQETYDLINERIRLNMADERIIYVPWNQIDACIGNPMPELHVVRIDEDGTEYVTPNNTSAFQRWFYIAQLNILKSFVFPFNEDRQPNPEAVYLLEPCMEFKWANSTPGTPGIPIVGTPGIQEEESYWRYVTEKEVPDLGLGIPGTNLPPVAGPWERYYPTSDRAFVSYPVFNEHAQDQKQHIQPLERSNFERAYNYLYKENTGITRFPAGTRRVLGSGGNFDVALEQIKDNKNVFGDNTKDIQLDAANTEMRNFSATGTGTIATANISTDLNIYMKGFPKYPTDNAQYTLKFISGSMQWIPEAEYVTVEYVYGSTNILPTKTNHIKGTELYSPGRPDGTGVFPPGYEFSHWSLTSQGTDFFIPSGDKIINANTKLHAVVKKRLINVFFLTGQDGVFNGFDDPSIVVTDTNKIIVEWGSKIPQPKDPTKTGSTFKNIWELNGKDWNFTQDNLETDELSVSLVAQWDVERIPVIFVTADGREPRTVFVDYNRPAARPSDLETRTHYTFNEWRNGSTVFNFSTPITSTITITATWIPIPYTVTFYSNNNPEKTSTLTRNADNPKYQLPDYRELGFDNDYHNFECWATSRSEPTDINDRFDAGKEFNIIDNTAPNYYAIWKREPVTIIYKYNDGRTDLVTSAVYGTNIDLINPIRPGFDFTGWNTDEAPTVLFKSPPAIQVFPHKENTMTFNANWEREQDTSTWDIDVLVPAGAGQITFNTIRTNGDAQGIDTSNITNENLTRWIDGDGDENNTGYCIDLIVSSTDDPRFQEPGTKIAKWWEPESTIQRAAQYKQHWVDSNYIQFASGAAFTLMVKIRKFK